MEELVGSDIDGWKVTGKIGEGAMGVVYRAKKGDQRAAFKIALPDVLGPDNLQRFRREAKILMELDHPHIVGCYHAGEADRFVYLALEHLDGRDLDAILAEKGKLSVPQAVGVTRRVLLGLEAAHQRGVLHRDIKPGNVMLDSRGVPKLLDFGLAKGKGHAKITMAGAVLGTIDYMAPEQFESVTEADPRADLYSVGCMLYHLVTGKPPYTGRSSLSILQQHKEAPIPSPVREGGVPEAEVLEPAIEALMAKERSERPKNARAALKLFEGMEEEPLYPGAVLDPPPEEESASAGGGKPSRLLDLIAALATVAAGVLGADYGMRRLGQGGLLDDVQAAGLDQVRDAPGLWVVLGVAAVLVLWRIVARRG
jgi:serine/threonine-protein kinase